MINEIADFVVRNYHYSCLCDFLWLLFLFPPTDMPASTNLTERESSTCVYIWIPSHLRDPG